MMARLIYPSTKVCPDSALRLNKLSPTQKIRELLVLHDIHRLTALLDDPTLIDKVCSRLGVLNTSCNLTCMSNAGGSRRVLVPRVQATPEISRREVEAVLASTPHRGHVITAVAEQRLHLTLEARAECRNAMSRAFEVVLSQSFGLTGHVMRDFIPPAFPVGNPSPVLRRIAGVNEQIYEALNMLFCVNATPDDKTIADMADARIRILSKVFNPIDKLADLFELAFTTRTRVTVEKGEFRSGRVDAELDLVMREGKIVAAIKDVLQRRYFEQYGGVVSVTTKITSPALIARFHLLLEPKNRGISKE